MQILLGFLFVIKDNHGKATASEACLLMTIPRIALITHYYYFVYCILFLLGRYVVRT